MRFPQLVLCPSLVLTLALPAGPAHHGRLEHERRDACDGPRPPGTFAGRARVACSC